MSMRVALLAPRRRLRRLSATAGGVVLGARRRLANERMNEIYKPNDMTQYDSFACTSRSALQRRFCRSLHATETIRRPLRTDSFIPRANRPLPQILPTVAALCFFMTDYTESSLGEWWRAGVVICLERGADLHTTQLMTLPLTVSCSSKIQIVCVCVCD